MVRKRLFILCVFLLGAGLGLYFPCYASHSTLLAITGSSIWVVMTGLVLALAPNKM